MRAVATAAQRIERSVSRRQLALSVHAATDPDRRQVTFGLVCELDTLGYDPVISHRWWADPLSGLHGPPGKPCPARPWVCLLCPLAVFAPRHAGNLLRLKAWFSRQWAGMPA